MQVDHIIMSTNIIMNICQTRDIEWKDDIHAEFVELNMVHSHQDGIMRRTIIIKRNRYRKQVNK